MSPKKGKISLTKNNFFALILNKKNSNALMKNSEKKIEKLEKNHF